MTAVRLRDGVELVMDSGDRVVCDANDPDGDVNVLSHAHGDHLYRNAPDEVICSALTAALARARREDEPHPRTVEDHPFVDLSPAGHIPGSRATLVTDPESGRRILYTGDCSTRERFGMDGLAPPDADVLVVETTYGRPEYEFAPQAELEREIVDFLDDTEGPLLLFGYTLGRAQGLQLLVERSSRTRPYVTEATERVNETIESVERVDYGARRYREDTELGEDDVLVLPSQTSKLTFVDHIVEETGATKVGFSGWATNSSFKFRGGYDETFVLSDHCDFSELVEVVEQVDPETVYTQHGFAEEFADHCVSLGYEAQALKRNQTSLGDF
ncbi:mRNA 3'-end processing factor [Halomarina salina]|uniref:mRNA 3'-end processing factor n=1 Tax=Halomarina salina TaxID=1872699 RepID=A0ABD5RKB5_9EURY